MVETRTLPRLGYGSIVIAVILGGCAGGAEGGALDVGSNDPAGGSGATPSGAGAGQAVPDAAGAATIGDDDDASVPSPRPPLLDAAAPSCAAKGSEVVMLGDSYPALSGEIPKYLMELATVAGTLAPGDAYRTYYVSGTGMAAGLDPSIPKQWAQAVAANPDVKYVIMDGGGNDVLIGNSSCITSQPPPGNASCVQTIQDAVGAATKLLADMKAAGVQKVLYYFYPHLPTELKPYVNDTLDYALPLVKAVCDQSPVPCTFVDPRALFDGHPEYIGPDGIHPTTAGSDVYAALLWAKMHEVCIAQ